jgi:hypothetical protein
MRYRYVIYMYIYIYNMKISHYLLSIRGDVYIHMLCNCAIKYVTYFHCYFQAIECSQMWCLRTPTA